MFLTPDGYQLIIQRLPVGIPTAVTVRALNATGVEIYSGRREGVIFVADEQLDLAVNLTSADSGASIGGAPSVRVIARPAAAVTIGSVVSLQFEITDANDSAVSFELRSSGAGTFEPASGMLPLTQGAGVLTCLHAVPQDPAIETVTIKVADSSGISLTLAFTINVVSPLASQRPGQVALGLNFPPTLERIVATHLSDEEIELTAAASDPESDELSYEWLDGEFSVSSSNPVRLQVGGGVITLTLIVRDANGAAIEASFSLDTDDPTIRDLPFVNRPPVITGALLSDQEVSYGQSVSLLIYARDLDDEVLSAAWSTDHGAMATGARRTSGEDQIFENTWSPALTAGVARITARIIDPRGGSVTHVFTIQQTLGRVELVAEAGPDRDGYAGTALLLDGSASSSADGVITSYLWEQTSGPASQISTPTSATTQVTSSAVGTYVYRLTVRNVNHIATDTVRVIATDPMNFAFDDLVQDAAGIVYFLDATDRLIRRYDLASGSFLLPYRTSQQFGARKIAVTPNADQLYVGYDGGRIDALNPLTGELTLFGTVASTPQSMITIGNYLLVMNSSSPRKSVFDRRNGARVSTSSSGYSGSQAVHSSTLNRVYYLREGVSPNDIHYIEVNPTTGILGAHVDSPYHGDYQLRLPIRLFPDQTRLVVGFGFLFRTSDMNFVGSLGFGVVDLAFLGNRPLTINTITTQTELTIMNPDLSVDSVRYYSGTALRVLTHGNRAVVITNRGTRRLGFEVLDLP